MVRVTAGDHPYFGRVVLDAPGLAHTLSREGDRVVVTFAESPASGTLPPLPRNVLALRGVPGGVELTVVKGAKVHDSRMGHKVVIDIDDAAPSPARPVSPPPAEARTGITPKKDPPRAEAPLRPVPFIPLASPAPVSPPSASVPPIPARPGSAAPVAARPASVPPASTSPASIPPPSPSATAARPVSPPLAAVASKVVAPERKPVAAEPVKPVSPAVKPVTPEPAAVVARRPEPFAGLPVLTPVPPPPEAEKPPSPTPPAAPVMPQTTDQTLDSAEAEATPVSIPPPPEPAQVWPVTRDAVSSGPVALIATRTRPPPGLTGAAIQIPFAEPVGAALFSHGSDTHAVFDERRPIDLAALRDDPVFGSAVVTIHPGATVIRLSTPPGQAAVLTRAQTGWRIAVVTASPRPAPLTPVLADGALTFAAEAPGQVVAITDPRTGGTLLVGTQRKPGQGILVERRMAEFQLSVTGQGIVVEPLADTVSLRVTQTGFVLSGPASGLALSPPMPMAEALLEAARLTRLYGLPGQATDILARHAKQQAAAAAAAPPLARGPKRRALAESLLGLGLAAEAQTVLRVAMKDDPREAASPATMGLAAIAALLAGRPREAGDLENAGLNGTDEIALWRGIRMAMADEGSPAAASLFAATAPLLFTYPEELRARVLPLVLETMVLGGAPDPAERLLSGREKDPRLAHARALLKQARGDHEGALKLFDAVADSRSPLDHARAAVRAIETRLTLGQLDAKGAAEALEKRLYAWRGDQRDLALRRRIAELRLKTGGWRPAFALLRAAKADFPDQAPAIDRQLKEAFAALPNDAAIGAMPPTELIALLEENTELMADGPDGEPMRVRLAEKLMALDLPKRADTVLKKLLRAAPIGPARAGFGATLATLRLREGDADGAMLALSESNAAEMPDPVRERRALITARVEAKRGDVKSAVETLAAVHTAEAEEARAGILEQAKDWPAARDALAVLAARVVPASGALDETQRGLMVRLATAAARAGDDAALASLREQMQTRIGTGPRADLFRLLTAEPVRGTADLGRARAEMGLARTVTTDMNAKKPLARTP